jgi:hypothetical protein
LVDTESSPLKKNDSNIKIKNPGGGGKDEKKKNC